MELFRKCVNRLIDLSERDGRSVPETIDTLRYYFSRISSGRTFQVEPAGKKGEKGIIPVIKKRKIRLKRDTYKTIKS